MKNRKNDRNNLTNEKEKTGLNEKFLNIYEPLSILDWSKTWKVLKKTNSYAFFQILPFNCKNFINFIDNTIHIIPRRFLLSAKNNQDFFLEEKEFSNLPFENYWESAKRSYPFKTKIGDVTFYKYRNFPFNHLFGKLNDKLFGKDLHLLFFDMICFFKDVEKLGNNFKILYYYN